MNKLQGLYLVLDPAQDKETLLRRLRQALDGGVALVQIWNHWPSDFSKKEKLELAMKIKSMAVDLAVPVLMNEEMELALEAELDGVHLDRVPENWEEIRALFRDKLVGITVGSDLNLVRWAEENQLSYISFCSVFSSSSVDTCELVHLASIQQARELTLMPIFLSGGIRLENLSELENYPYHGIAVISGILNAKDPKLAAMRYLQKMKKIR